MSSSPASMFLSLVICTYNNAALLERTLEKISEQVVSRPADSSEDWEVVVIDNNCSDHTAAVVERYQLTQRIPNLRRCVEPQQGLVYARLCGVSQSTGDWIAFIDDDCLLRSDWVANAIQFASARPQCGAFGGQVSLLWETPPSDTILRYQGWFAAQERGPEAIQVPNASFSHLVGAGMVVQRKALTASGWMTHQLLTGRKGTLLMAGDDSEIVIRIRQAGYEVWYSPCCVLQHFIPSHRISDAYIVKLGAGIIASKPYQNLLDGRSYKAWLRDDLSLLLKLIAKAMRLTTQAIARPSKRIDSRIMWTLVKACATSSWQIQSDYALYWNRTAQ